MSNGLEKTVFDYPCLPGLSKSHLVGSAVDSLQILTLSLSGRCAFSVLTLVFPDLSPPGSFAILLMADTGFLFPTLHY